MSISSVFGSPILLAPKSSSAPSFNYSNGDIRATPIGPGVGGGCGLAIECSSRPQKKATAHHRKTRPRKSQPWDIKRKPTVYPPLPPLPPDWTLISSAAEVDADATESPSPSTLGVEAPVTSG